MRVRDLKNGTIRLTSIFIIYILFNITISCQKQINDPLTNYVNFSEAIDLFTSDIFESLRIVELETIEESIFGEITELIVWDENVFIFDKDKTNAVFRFHRTGRLLNTYGHIGKGPKEYNNAKSFILDKKKSQVELLVGAGNIMTYNLQGDLINQFRNPTQLPALSFIKNNMGNYYYYCGHNNGFDKSKLFLLNEQGEITYKYFNENSNLFPFEEPNNNFFMHEDTIFFREAYDNHVYIFPNDQAIPYCYFDFNEYNLPSDIPKDFFISLEKFATLFNFHRNREFELSTIHKHEQNYTPEFYFILKNIESANNKVVKLPYLSTFIDSFVFPLYLTDENEIVFSVHPMDLALHSGIINSSPVFNKIIDEINTIEESANPILVFGKLKNF